MEGEGMRNDRVKHIRRLEFGDDNWNVDLTAKKSQAWIYGKQNNMKQQQKSIAQSNTKTKEVPKGRDGSYQRKCC